MSAHVFHFVQTFISKLVVFTCALTSGAVAGRAQRVYQSALYGGINTAGGRYDVEAEQSAMRYDQGGGGAVTGYSGTLYGVGEWPWFLQSGVQLRYAGSAMQTVGATPGFASATSRLYWRVNHQSLTMPLHVGRRYALGASGNTLLEPRAGISVG